MTDTLNDFDSFGALLKFLRRRAQLTQRDLGLAVGYTEAHVCRLERNQRLPDPTTLTALFVPALQLEDQPGAVARLMALATQARGRPATEARSMVTQVARQQVVEELGVLEDIPAAPTHAVARPQALARLRDALSRERMAALVGLPGMGKTTLAAALARAEAAARPVFWLSLTAREATAEALLRHLALFVVSMGDESVLGVLQADATPLPLGRQMSLVGGGLARTPALLCFDDAHLLTADEQVLETLRVLAGAAHPETRWLLVGREAVPLAEAAHMQLGGLEATEEQTLLERLGARLSPAQAEALRRKTGGSPFLLRLAVGQLLDRGAAPGPFIEHLETLPEAAAYLLGTFLAELAPPAARLATLLSIFRQPVNVYDELLVELAQAADGPYDLIGAVSALQRRQQIDHPAQANLHRLLRDHLYTTLVADLPRRRRLHKAVAEWYEHGRADWVEAAYHFAQAGQLVQAAGVLADRGSELFGRGEAAAGVAVVDEILQRARQRRADSADLRRSLLTTRGDLLVFGPRAVEGETNYREALSLAAQPAVRASLVWRLAQNLIQSGKAAEALALCRASAADLTPGEGLLRAQLATAEGWALLMLARYPEAEVAAGQALALAEPFAGLAPRAVDEVRARSHHVLGVAHSIRGQPDLAVEHWQRTMEAARRAGLRQVENRCLMNIGMVLYQYHDDLAGALRCFNQALEQARALGDTYLMGRLLTNIGLTQHLSNDVEAAQHTLAEAAELRRQMGELPGVANVENMRALVQLALGQVDEARARLERVMRETEHIGDQRVRSILVDTLAVANLVAGNHAPALAALRREAANPGLHDDVKMRNELDSHLALALLASGDLVGARDLLATAPPAAGGPECRFERELIVGLTALAGGDPAAARAAAESVAERAGAIGYKLNAAAARRIMAALAVPPPPAEYPRLIWGPTRST